jgi:hypothetical protein
MYIIRGWKRPIVPPARVVEAPKVEAPPELVQARVLANYGGHSPGDVIEVDIREVARVPHALITLDEEQRRREEQAQRQALQQAQQAARRDPFDKMRSAFERGAAEARRVLAEQHARAEAERAARAKEIGKEIGKESK